MADWTITAPLPGEQFDDDGEVDWYGDAPAADVTFQFKVLQHGLGPVIATSGAQITEDTWWNFAISPPEDMTWPIGVANAAIYSATDRESYVTIEFMEP